MEVCKLYEKYFPVNRIRPLLLWKFNTNIFKHLFGKAVPDKELSITHLILHQGNKHI
jgi:hypothetical protein